MEAVQSHQGGASCRSEGSSEGSSSTVANVTESKLLGNRAACTVEQRRLSCAAEKVHSDAGNCLVDGVATSKWVLEVQGRGGAAAELLTWLWNNTGCYHRLGMDIATALLHVTTANVIDKGRDVAAGMGSEHCHSRTAAYNEGKQGDAKFAVEEATWLKKNSSNG